MASNHRDGIIYPPYEVMLGSPMGSSLGNVTITQKNKSTNVRDLCTNTIVKKCIIYQTIGQCELNPVAYENLRT